MPNRNICTRIPDGMDAAVDALVAAQGVSISEWLRNLVYQAVYQQSPTFDDGYFQGKSLGLHYALVVAQEAFRDSAQTPEEALAYLKAHTAGVIARSSNR